MNFMAMLNSNPQSKKEFDQVKKFLKEIKPDNKVNEVKEPKVKKKPQWSKRVQEKIEARKRKEQLN